MLLFQLLLVLLLVFLNGFFVASEFALVAIRKTRIEELIKKGNNSAKLVLNAVNDLESYISATQLGITLASLALGWVGEPAVAHVIQPFFSFLPDEAAFITSHSLAVVIAFSLITFLHIVLGELAPKSIALQSSEKTALFIITPLLLFTKIFRPFIWLLNSAGSLVLKLFGFTAPTGHQLVHSEEEIKLILKQSAQEGALEAGEVRMIHRVLQLADIPVENVMIPRTEIKAISADATIKQLKRLVKEDVLTRYPVYKGTIDTIIGYIHEKDVYKSALQKDITLLESNIIRQTIFVPQVQRIDDVLQEMRKKHVLIAVVNDEYGGTLGIVTLEDILESIVGEIYDEFDKTETEIKKETDGSYIIDGMVPVNVIQQKFKVHIKGQGYVTIGGVIFGLLGRQPKVGDSVQIGNLKMKVKEVEKKRIKTIVLKKVQK
jgi:CBS domain containing-hemolysin-like protein